MRYSERYFAAKHRIFPREGPERVLVVHFVKQFFQLLAAAVAKWSNDCLAFRRYCKVARVARHFARLATWSATWRNPSPPCTV